MKPVDKQELQEILFDGRFFFFFVNANLKAFAKDLRECVCQRKKQKKKRNPSKQVGHGCDAQMGECKPAQPVWRGHFEPVSSLL